MASNEEMQEPSPGGGGTGTYWAAVAGLVLLVGIVGFALVRRQSPQGARPQPEGEQTEAVQAEAEQPAAETNLIKAEVRAALSPEARIMTERYRCVCGCDDRLSVCTCENRPGSRDMKAYVEELVSSGKSIAEVDRAMVERYGEQVMFTEPE